MIPIMHDVFWGPMAYAIVGGLAVATALTLVFLPALYVAAHQTLKNRVLLENYYLPGALEAEVGAFVGHYNHARYHESLHNLTPANVYFGRGQTILLERERIKRRTIANRRLQHHAQAA